MTCLSVEDRRAARVRVRFESVRGARATHLILRPARLCAIVVGESSGRARIVCVIDQLSVPLPTVVQSAAASDESSMTSVRTLRPAAALPPHPMQASRAATAALHDFAYSPIASTAADAADLCLRGGDDRSRCICVRFNQASVAASCGLCPAEAAADLLEATVIRGGASGMETREAGGDGKTHIVSCPFRHVVGSPRAWRRADTLCPSIQHSCAALRWPPNADTDMELQPG